MSDTLKASDIPEGELENILLLTPPQFSHYTPHSHIMRNASFQLGVFLLRAGSSRYVITNFIYSGRM